MAHRGRRAQPAALADGMTRPRPGCRRFSRYPRGSPGCLNAPCGVCRRDPTSSERGLGPFGGPHYPLRPPRRARAAAPAPDLALHSTALRIASGCGRCQRVLHLGRRHRCRGTRAVETSEGARATAHRGAPTRGHSRGTAPRRCPRHGDFLGLGESPNRCGWGRGYGTVERHRPLTLRGSTT